MNVRRGKIGLFGGTFNPIHNGHLFLAEELRAHLQLDRVFFIPAASPVHKPQGDLAPAWDRLTMATLATVSHPCFDVSPVEVERPGPSYSIDTVRFFRKQLGPEVELYWLMGADAVMHLASWKDPDVLVRECRVVAAGRPGYDLNKILQYRQLGASGGQVDLWEHLQIAEVPTLDISSRQIRERVRGWKSIRYWVPEPVEQYIHHRRLYVD